MSLLAAITRIDLTATAEANLVNIVRSTEVGHLADMETGKTKVVYRPNAEQDAALQTLIAAYIQDIRKASRTARVLDRDDAEGVCLEKFISLVRDTTRSNDRLAGFVGRAMVNAVMDADAESSAVRIPHDTLRRYFNLVRDSGSVEAAYAAAEANGFDKITLLAVHRALNAESVEAIAARQEGDSAAADPFAAHSTPGHEEAIVQADLVRWLLTLVPEVQATILRLAYGFTDAQTEALRVEHGYQWDEVLSDAQVSPVVAMGRVTVNRNRNAALVVMRDALQTAVAQESASA